MFKFHVRFYHPQKQKIYATIMKELIRLFLLTLILGCLGSCASYRIQYADKQNKWKQPPLPQKPLQHQVFLVGDAGGDKNGKPVDTLRIIEQKLKEASKNSSVIFLGDNIRKGGLPPKNDLNRNSILYFSLGLALALFITWIAMEHKSYDKDDYAGLLKDELIDDTS